MTGTGQEIGAAGRARQGGGVALGLAAGAFLCLAAGGALLWWRQGQEIFLHAVTTAFAWCF